MEVLAHLGPELLDEAWVLALSPMGASRDGRLRHMNASSRRGRCVCVSGDVSIIGTSFHANCLENLVAGFAVGLGTSMSGG